MKRISLSRLEFSDYISTAQVNIITSFGSDAVAKSKLMYAPALILAIAGFGASEAHASGTWTRGPGVYSFKICATSVANPNQERGRAASLGKFEKEVDASSGVGGPAGIAGSSSAGAASAPRGGSRASAAAAGVSRGGGCDINGFPGQSVTLTIEAWGGGGGGSGGLPGVSGPSLGGIGGSGGGGAGYGRAIVTVTVPIVGATTYFVRVGAGGAGGDGGAFNSSAASVSGGKSEVRINSASGPLVASGAGGARGLYDYMGGGGWGGVPGSGTPDSWAGTAGYPGTPGGQCNGGAGGFGGAGGGPGRTGPGYIGDGGDGGHGGYNKRPGCTQASLDYGRTLGVAGRNGQVKISW